MPGPQHKLRPASRLGLLALCAASACLAPGAAAPALGGLSPENVAVVVNEDSWASKAVANAFVHLRGVPAPNVVYLRGLPSFEIVKVDTFREKILGPVLQQLEARGVLNQIDCIAYSSDLPHAIDVAQDKEGTELPKVITPKASINGLTYLFPLVLQKNPSYLGLGINFYARTPVSLVQDDTQWSSEEQARYQEIFNLFGQEKHAEATSRLEELAEDHPGAAHVHYNLACAHARAGKEKKALAALKTAAETGWRDTQKTSADEDLASVRGSKEFRKIIDYMQQLPVETRPTVGFSSRFGWNREGGRVSLLQGMRYMLSTMLAVTSGRGTSVSEAVRCLERGVSADATHPAGTIYFMQNSGIRSKTRSWAFDDAVRQLAELGIGAEIIKGTLPKAKGDVMGLLTGSATLDLAGAGNTVLPGAICENFTSMGGVMGQKGGQTPLSDFLRAGAVASSGTVTEPYSLQQKFPMAFLQVHYARGCSAAEAFYQSVTGPYQLLIVGDPVCAPWANPPLFVVDGIEPGQTVQGSIKLTPLAPLVARTPSGGFELYVDGIRRAVCLPGRSLLLDTEQLPDGHHELRLVALGGDAVMSRSRLVFPVLVDNHGRRLELKPADGGPVRLGQTLELQASMEAGKKLVLYHNGRELDEIEGAAGTFRVEADRLGQGEVTVRAVGFVDTQEQAAAVSAPLTVNVVPPDPLGGSARRRGRTWEGLELNAGKTREVIKETTQVNWLAKAKVKPGQAFTLDGNFDITREDVYQFQLRSPLAVSIEINDTPLEVPSGGGWKYIPVALAPGGHRLRVSSPGGESLRLDLRFGGWNVQHRFTGLLVSPAPVGKEEVMLVVHVHVHVKPDCVDAFKTASLENARHSLQEPGIVRFDVTQQQDDPTRFVLVEVYRTEDDPARHKETAHYQAWRETVEPMMAEPRASTRQDPLFPAAPGWETAG